MKFRCKTAKDFYTDVDEINRLKTIGFTFKRYHSRFMPVPEPEYIISGEPVIEIDTLDDLMRFIAVHGDVVISDEGIIIYNGYLE